MSSNIFEREFIVTGVSNIRRSDHESIKGDMKHPIFKNSYVRVDVSPYDLNNDEIDKTRSFHFNIGNSNATFLEVFDSDIKGVEETDGRHWIKSDTLVEGGIFKFLYKLSNRNMHPMEATFIKLKN